MSTAMIPKPELTTVCDLCGKPVDVDNFRDRCALNWATTPLASLANTRPKHFLFFRKRHGDRRSGAPAGDYREWQWDFHGECLVDTLGPLIEAGAANQPNRSE